MKRKLISRKAIIGRLAVLMAPAAMLPAALICSGSNLAATPATRQAATRATTGSSDDTLDFLLQQAASQPGFHPKGRAATRAASQPATPFLRPDEARTFGFRQGTIHTSDGEKIRGRLSTTLEKPMRVWDEQSKQYVDIPFSEIQQIEASIVWERLQPEWHFKESGSDIKEYSGKTYPAREMQYTVTFKSGYGGDRTIKSITGDIVSPIYLNTPEGQKIFILHKRDKGEVGQTLKDLVYVTRVTFDDSSKKPSTTQAASTAASTRQTGH